MRVRDPQNDDKVPSDNHSHAQNSSPLSFLQGAEIFEVERVWVFFYSVDTCPPPPPPTPQFPGTCKELGRAESAFPFVLGFIKSQTQNYFLQSTLQTRQMHATGFSDCRFKPFE